MNKYVFLHDDELSGLITVDGTDVKTKHITIDFDDDLNVRVKYDLGTKGKAKQFKVPLYVLAELRMAMDALQDNDSWFCPVEMYKLKETK